MNEVIGIGEIMDSSKLNLRPVVTSHSIDGTFESCPRRFEFSHVWQQLPEGGSTGFAAEVGTALHEAVQAWARLALFPGRARHARNELAVQVGLKELLRWWPWALEHVSLREGKAGIKQRSLGEAILLYEEIIAAEFWESWELIHIGKFGLSIEIPWRISHVSLGTFPLWNGKLGYMVTQGKIDFVLRNRFTGEIRVLDLKTTVKEEQAHKSAYRFSGQATGYGMVLGQAMGLDWKAGLTVSYIVANFAAADGTEDAAVRLRTYTHSAEEIQDGIDTKVERLERMVAYAKRGNWPRKQHGCDSFNQPCPYLNVCHRRDPEFIAKWFAFEGFEERPRIYEPIWELMA